MNWLLLNHASAEQSEWYINDVQQLAHIQQQLKLNVGDELKVLLPNVGRYRCRLLALSATSACVAPLEYQENPAKHPVHLVLALPRPKVLRRMMMDATSMGVAHISLIQSYRVDKSYWQTPFLQQLAQYVQLGLEQAGDAVAPPITLHKRFKPFVQDELAQWISPERPALLAHPYAEQAMPRDLAQPCMIIVGPEGGFIPYEVELFKQNGCQAYHLGSRILRTETALSYLLGRLL